MSKTSALKLTALAAAFAATAVPMTASAEVSGSLSISNMYFWRGQDISAGGAQVAGSLDYAHSSGLHAGMWTSSETDTTEYDLYAGWGGESGGFSYDITYWDYNYPNDTASDVQEVVVSGGAAGVSAAAYIGTGKVGHGSDAVDNKDNYFTLGYSYDKYSVLVGTWDKDAPDSNYTHVDLSYALTDQFTVTASKIVSADDDTMPDDLLFVVGYSFKL